MPTKSESIKAFLQISTKGDLGSMYSLDMECQVNVAQDNGERVVGEFKGRKWQGWTDGLTTWKSFRIPYKANSEPEYTDSEINFDLAAHVEGIGMTGWNWKERVSRWVAFDFDAIIGHSANHTNKLTPEELENIVKILTDIEWVTIRKSTSGHGLHVYVYVDSIPTANHNEHAALARSILGKLSALTGYDFKSKVDNCGGNMWVWHRKMQGTDGLTVIKQGDIMCDVPENWRDHIPVVAGTRRRNLPQVIQDSVAGDVFEELVGQRPRTQLDDIHKKLIQFLTDSNAFWWWDQDHHMLVTHTIHLQEAYDSLQLKGIFKTISTGKEKGQDHNCFCFPLRNGGWSVRRYTPGIQEHDSWTQDTQGWTTCYLNKEPDIATACRAYGGLEDPSGGFVFREAEVALKALRLVGVHGSVAPAMGSRQTTIKQHKDGRAVMMLDHDPNDRSDEMQGWLAKKGKWTRIFNVSNSAASEPEIGNYDDIIRHLVTEQREDYGWMLKSDNQWQSEPLKHIQVSLGSLGLNPKELTSVLGSAIFCSWKLVNRPFQPEYPGDREWNRSAAQFRYKPHANAEGLHYPTWKKILNHCGSGLDDVLKNNVWARVNGILTGEDYLKCWISSLFKEPTEPLPYLFFYGPQNSGKSIFHEAIALLMTKGYKRSDAALVSQSGFNAELEGAILCIIEETDLRKNKAAYNRIKDWVTSRDLLIHAKGKTPYHIRNTSHWVQCANDYQACPIFAGDTRITMCYVKDIEPVALIPKRQMIALLEKEASDFLTEILNLELPASNDRLNVPAVETADKTYAQQLTQTSLESFIAEHCTHVPGRQVLFASFYDRFIEWLDPNEVHNWSRIKVGKELPPTYPRARFSRDGQVYIGNIYVDGIAYDDRGARLGVVNNYLEVVA